jgi:methylated-DNA-protein-cysteine methyltransferase-like protein
MDPFHSKVKDIIRSIPSGKVATYGQIAALAGNPRAARQVVRVLHSSTKEDDLPWHRVVNRQGQISLKPGHGYEIQRGLLEQEGVILDDSSTIDFDQYIWMP